MSTIELIHNTVLDLLGRRRIRAKRYLDVGCGDCSFTLRLAEAVGAVEVYGVDISDVYVKEKPIKVLKCDVHKEKLPFPEAYFDLVTAIEVIEHMSFGDNLVKNCYSVLKAGGYLLITTPNLANWVNRLLLLFGYQLREFPPSRYYLVGYPYKPKSRPSAYYRLSHKTPEPYSEHLSGYTLKGLCDLLRVHGFELISKVGCPYYFERFKLLNVIEKSISRVPSLAGHIVVLARKR